MIPSPVEKTTLTYCLGHVGNFDVATLIALAKGLTDKGMDRWSVIISPTDSQMIVVVSSP